jgi:hypothetical protein
LTDMGQNQVKTGKKQGTLSRKKTSERNYVDGSGMNDKNRLMFFTNL